MQAFIATVVTQSVRALSIGAEMTELTRVVSLSMLESLSRAFSAMGSHRQSREHPWEV